MRDFEKMSKKHFDNFVFRHFMKSGNYAAYSRRDIEKLMVDAVR